MSSAGNEDLGLQVKPMGRTSTAPSFLAYAMLTSPQSKSTTPSTRTARTAAWPATPN